MFARPIRNLTFVSAALLGALACGSVDSAEDTSAKRQEAASTARRSVTTTLFASGDARTQAATPDTNFGLRDLWVNTINHQTFVQFDDMLQIPTDARIESAKLVLSFDGTYAQTNSVEVGQVQGPWDEMTLTWNNQPAITWNGPSTDIGDVAGDVSWDVTDMVRSWQDGSAPNYGFGLRAPSPGGKQFYSKDWKNHPPQLVVTYSIPVPPAGPVPDVGDAPDNSNHLGVPNNAYVGVLGNFPTVYQVTAGQVAGPLHENATLQAFLGNAITAERDADIGFDPDGPNNILHTTATTIANVSNRDAADDGWLNRNIRFYDCLEQTLTVRVMRPIGATQPFMYLNVWFDGDQNGAWAGNGPCMPPGGGPVQQSTEWIVQNYQVNMLTTAPGTYMDLSVPTEVVYNPATDTPHWMRFTLSEVPAVVPPGVGQQPDGRGPHPLSAQKSFQFGETEDYLQRPPPPGTLGELALEHRLTGASDPEPYAGTVSYEIQLTNVGGTGPAPAFIHEELPFGLFPAAGTLQVTSPGGAVPLNASLSVHPASGSSPETTIVSWNGMLDPDSSVTLRFNALAIPECGGLLQRTTTFVSHATAGSSGTVTASADTSLSAQCRPLTTLPYKPDIDLSSLPIFP